MSASAQSGLDRGRGSWPDYAAVWRWHFYAGLFCLPFICWLAVTGSIYLFRPDIEAWLDRPYEGLTLDGPRATPSAEAAAAIAAVPGSAFSRYEPPATPTGAAQVLVSKGGNLLRVVVHPVTLQPMKIERDDHRPMELVSHLHGQLLLGTRGSVIVELAASWGVVMFLTGLYLWFPRGRTRLGGLLYPRMALRGRYFWRDLHAVTGMWVSIVALFLLLSGLPWSSNWGKYLTWARSRWTVTAGTPDWPVGGVVTAPSGAMPGMTAAEMAAMPGSPPQTDRAAISRPADLQVLDRLVPVAARLQPPRPVWISSPESGQHDWTISSHIQDRPLRITYSVNPETAEVTRTEAFAGLNIVDKVVNVAIATHEGQLFGRINQAILLLTALSLLLVSASAIVMWWRRRPAKLLGAPPPSAAPRFSSVLVLSIGALGLVLPLFGLSLVLLLVVDRTVLARRPGARRWLGLARA